MVLVLMIMRVRCVGGLTPLLLVLVVMIEGCLGGAGTGGVGGRQNENLRSGGNLWFVVVIVVVLKLTHAKLFFTFWLFKTKIIENIFV